MSGYLRANFFSTITDPDGTLITDVMSFKFFDFRSYLIGRTVNSVIVSGMTAGLPDLISFLQYGTENYWWVICVVNGIVDPANEIIAGMTLIIPLLNDITTFSTLVKTSQTSSPRVVIL